LAYFYRLAAIVEIQPWSQADYFDGERQAFFTVNMTLFKVSGAVAARLEFWPSLAAAGAWYLY
jgi:hypothetical protein